MSRGEGGASTWHGGQRAATHALIPNPPTHPPTHTHVQHGAGPGVPDADGLVKGARDLWREEWEDEKEKRGGGGGWGALRARARSPGAPSLSFFSLPLLFLSIPALSMSHQLRLARVEGDRKNVGGVPPQHFHRRRRRARPLPARRRRVHRGRHVPHAGRRVVARGRNVGAVGGPGHVVEAALVVPRAQDGQAGPGGGVPDAGGAVAGAGGQAGAVGGPADGGDARGVA